MTGDCGGECTDGVMLWDLGPDVPGGGDVRWIERCDECEQHDTDVDAAKYFAGAHATRWGVAIGKYAGLDVEYPWVEVTS